MPQRFAKTRNEPATCSHALVPPSGLSGSGAGTLRVVASFSLPVSTTEVSSDNFEGTGRLLVGLVVEAIPMWRKSDWEENHYPDILLISPFTLGSKQGLSHCPKRRPKMLLESRWRHRYLYACNMSAAACPQERARMTEPRIKQ